MKGMARIFRNEEKKGRKVLTAREDLRQTGTEKGERTRVVSGTAFRWRGTATRKPWTKTAVESLRSQGWKLKREKTLWENDWKD